MAKVHYSTIAAADIYENAEYIARDKPDAAYNWVESIEASCRLLAINPELGQQRKTLRIGNCRGFVCGTFVIFFRGVSDGVEIILSFAARVTWTAFDLGNLGGALFSYKYQ